MTPPSNSDERTCIFLRFLCVLIALLQTSHGLPTDSPSNVSTNLTSLLDDTPSVNDTATVPPTPSPAPTPGTTMACQKMFVNIKANAPLMGCLPGLIKGVPACSGVCNSYENFQVNRRVHYKECCQATTYRSVKRNVTFQCNGATRNISYYMASAIDCNCMSDGVVNHMLV